MLRKIPHDIDRVITEVDRHQHYDVLPTKSTPMDRYDEDLKRLLPCCQIVNITEFDYGRAHRYRIVLSDDPRTSTLDIDQLKKAISIHGNLNVVRLAVSVIAPYYLVGFSSYSIAADELLEARSDTPLDDSQTDVLGSLFGYLAKLGFHRIDNKVARLQVDDVQTDLCDVGQATVADCLFFG